MMRLGVSYYGTRDTRHVARDLDEIAGCCTYVLHTFSENDRQFAKGNMAEVIRETRARGMEAQVGPWGVAGLFGGEAYSDWVNYTWDVRQVLSNGHTAPIACPLNPRTLPYLYGWIDDALEIGAEVIFWDEPHYFIPGWLFRLNDDSLWGCRCEHCQHAFKQRTGKDLPLERTEEVLRFQDEVLTEFIQSLCDYTERAGARNSVCVLPHKEAMERGFWERVTGIPSAHCVGTDPYWGAGDRSSIEAYQDDFFVRAGKEILQLTGEKNHDSHIWIKAFHIQKGMEDLVGRAVRKAYEMGFRDISTWSFRGVAVHSLLASENPDAVWSHMKEAYLECKARAEQEE